MKNKWEIVDLINLTNLKKLNPNQHKEIVERYDNFNDFNDSEQYQRFFDKNQGNLFFENETITSADDQLNLCEINKVNIITIWDDEYPHLLKKIAHPPILLFVKGELQKADSPTIGIVGTRHCTQYGRLTAERYAQKFASNGVIVVSGLAYGIDTYSHLATIKAGGITYAVIAGGIDKHGPATATEKANKILDSGGAIISHFRCGVNPLPPLFLQRNRVIAGISSGVVIIESGKRGGALNTARYAAEESRDVFAVPGNITSEKSEGTNILIKNGSAIPTLSADDVLENLGFTQTKIVENDTNKKISFQNKEIELIYNALSYEPIHVDALPEKTGLEIITILVNLLTMEFNGLVRQLPGKNYIREG